MRAVVVEKTGGAEVLRLVERDPGAPGPGTARVRVSAAGVNYIDVYFRTGLYAQNLPYVAGLEGAGVIEAVGPGAASWKPGDRVAWSSIPGSYAGALIAPCERLLRIPEGVSDEVAAAVMLQGMTAHYLTHATRQTRPGDLALVHAAAGGVGLLLTQMLVAAGATVLGTCSTDEKEKLAREAGVHHAIRYNRVAFDDEVRRITQGRGCDVVYDSVGRDTFEASLRSLAPRGLLVLYGQSSGPVPPFDLGRLNALGSLFVTRPSLAHYTRTRVELEERSNAVFQAIAERRLAVRISERFPLSQASEAHRALEARRTTGKILLLPEA
jgi:NADPH2:quinone reductase